MARIVDRRIVEARILLPGPQAGDVLPARLVSRGEGSRNAVARAADGTDYLLPSGARGVDEGRALNIAVTRAAIPGTEPWKRPLAKVTDEEPQGAEEYDATELAFPAPADLLREAHWDDVIEEARSGMVPFPGGELTIQVTRAMTLIDVDGRGDPAELAMLGAKAAAEAILRLDIQGSIGIDLPTTSGKDARHRAAQAIDFVLPQPFERTAVNGFGFVQVVRPRRRPSLIELAGDSAPFEARALMRRAARLTGAITIAAHPALIAAIKPAWLAALTRQVGGEVTLRAEPSLAISAGHVQPNA